MIILLDFNKNCYSDDCQSSSYCYYDTLKNGVILKLLYCAKCFLHEELLKDTQNLSTRKLLVVDIDREIVDSAPIVAHFSYQFRSCPQELDITALTEGSKGWTETVTQFYTATLFTIDDRVWRFRPQGYHHEGCSAKEVEEALLKLEETMKSKDEEETTSLATS